MTRFLCLVGLHDYDGTTFEVIRGSRVVAIRFCSHCQHPHVRKVKA